MLGLNLSSPLQARSRMSENFQGQQSYGYGIRQKEGKTEANIWMKVDIFLLDFDKVLSHLEK